MVKRKYELTKSEVIERWAKNYPKVITWIAKLQRKNENAWHLWLYCKLMKKNPDELLGLKSDPRSREAEYLLDTFVADETLDIPNSLKVKTTVSVKSFYKHNYCDLARACGQITFVKQTPYRKHTKEELLKIYRATQNPRDRLLITFTWSSSIARESLINIKWKYLEDDWQKHEIPHISLPPELIKGHGRGKYRGVRQETFLTPEAKRDLIDYKDWLERVKEVKLTRETNIFLRLQKPFEPLVYETLSKIACDLSKRSGVKFTWHDARRYVETALEEIKIHPNWARKIRGRKIRGEENPYSRPAIEQLRNAYREAVPLLEFTQPTQLMELQKRQEIVEELQGKIFAGKPLTEEDFAKAKRYNVRFVTRDKRHIEKTVKEAEDPNDCANGEHCETFKEINESELLSHLQQGWKIEYKSSNGSVIVRKGR